MTDRSFEVVSSSSKIKTFVLPAAAAIVVAGVLIFVFSGSREAPSQPAPAPAPAPVAATQAPQPQPGVRVVAKDPAQQAELDQQLQKLLYFVANPTLEDANITIQFLVNKFDQPPEVVIPDLFVLIRDLQALSDENLVAFFKGAQNPWLDDQGYNAIINFISYRDYLEFVKKCATIYQVQIQSQAQTRSRTPG